MEHPRNIKTVVDKSTYEVPIFEVTNEGLQDAGTTLIKFCKGNKADENAFRQPGFFTETLLEACAQYLRENNVGDLATRDTSIAITHIEDAILRLNKRAEDRKLREVQGTYNK
jgi:hypothetical protein